MRVLICNERFLFRFGLDRVLIILAQGLKKSGNQISFAVLKNKYDKDVLGPIATQVIEIPEGADQYLNSNEYTVEWLNNNWKSCFDQTSLPDIVLIGGWPFFAAIPFFKSKGCTVIFSDHGAVPIDGFSGGTLQVQEKLRTLRKKFLPQCNRIIAVSDFIAKSQSLSDTGGKIPVDVVLNGANHLEMALWMKDSLGTKKISPSLLSRVNKYKNQGKKILLLLGRWEPNTYKNSETVIDLLTSLKKARRDCVLLILADELTVCFPPSLNEEIVPVGYPDDSELNKIMQLVDLGVCVSKWEGFNLPLAEMQWLGKPVIALNIGAHPEVVIRQYFLCENIQQIEIKIEEILWSNSSTPILESEILKFKNFFTWERAIEQYKSIFACEMMKKTLMTLNEVSLLIDVTNAARDTANSGVIRVTRRMSQELQKYVSLLFVIWDWEKKQYVFPTKSEFAQLSQFNGPSLTKNCVVSPENIRLTLDDFLKENPPMKRWLIFTETIDENRAKLIRQFVKNHAISLAAIFYDAIPVLYPELCKDVAVRNNHGYYMTGLADCDVVIPISEFSAECLKEYWKDHQIKACTVKADLLPGEFGGVPRNTSIGNVNCNKISMLCVSTLEPRKNHKTLIEACLLLQKEHPDINWSLTLVGNRYAGAFEIAEEIQIIAKENPRIKWLGVVSDTSLHRLYEEATFTVYPSIIEGFGMPILESIWHGKPVICSNTGVMSELASDGGCLTTDVLDKKEFSNALYQLCTDKVLLQKLSLEAVERPIKSWDEYVQQFLSVLKIDPQGQISQAQMKNVPGSKVLTVEEILYPQCLCENWQMNHSERMALTALLMRHKPRCSIEIGTYKGGSLSLISQLSKFVYSLDIDPSIPEKFSQFQNVTFITGSSIISLPLLLKALDSEKVPVDFILIDGDHSADGVKKDLNSVLAYAPKKPLFVMMHDSGNPECRRGMLEADWKSSPYVQWVDLDFIPGRIIENGSSSQGELWGGLALAYLTPEIRNTSFVINQSANMMYEFMRTYSLPINDNRQTPGN
jgi:glycosyltransferase involved in cell wall biosynthesis